VICAVAGGAFCAFLALAAASDDPRIAFAFLAGAGFFLFGAPISASACVNELAPNAMRARLTSVYNLAVALLSNAVGPVLIGVLNDRVFASPDAIGRSLMWTAIVCGVLGVLVLLGGRGAYRRALQTPS
jgi:MFS family permease